MKQRLLSFVAIAALSCVAMAQTWTEPVKPTNPALGFLEIAADPVDGGNFFLMNVGEGQFLTGANVWATQISLSADAIPYMQLTTVEIEEESGIFKLRRTNDANDKFYGDHDREGGYNPPAGRNLLFRGGDDGYVDENGQGGDRFVFNKSDNNYYYFQSDVTEGKFADAENQYAGSTGAGKYVSFTKAKTDDNIEWVFIPVDEVVIAEYKPLADAYAAQMLIYEARLALYNTLVDAAKYGVDYAYASTVYNNPDATVDQLTAAQEELQPEVNHAALMAAIAASSEETPYDVTQYVLKNPSFDEGMKGWTITEGMGQNQQVQAKHYPENNPEAESFIENFIEAWRVSTEGPLSDGVICQTVTGLPEGRYRIEADVMAVWQGAALSEEPKGIYLYYNNGKFTLHGESLSTGNGVPEHFTFDFDYDGAAEMTIGLMAENTNQNWMGFDNLKLFAIGEVQTPPSFYALLSEVETSEPYNDEGDNLIANAGLRTSFQNAFSAAYKLADDQNPTKEKAKNYENAYQALHDARVALEASIEDYKNLNALIERIQSDYAAYEGQSMYEDLRTQLNSMMEEYQGGYENGSYTKEQIDELIAAYDNVLKNYVQGLFDKAAGDAASGITLDDPINITSLFEHMSYEYSTTAVDKRTEGYPNENPVWINETKSEKFKTQYSTAEIWNDRPFRISRTFEDLPAGRYEIRVHGFYRMAANNENYNNYIADAYVGNEGAFLFAGNKKTAFTNVAAIAETVAFEDFAEIKDGEGDEAPILCYVPNSQAAAHNLFSDAGGKYGDKTELCYIAAATNVKDGTLTVGVEGNDNLQANQWTVWQDFELYYYGAADADALDEEIEALIITADAIYTEGGEGDAAILVQSILKGLNTAMTQGYDALGTDADTQKAAIKALEDAIALARENMSVFTELMALVSERDAAIQDLADYTFDDPSGYLTLLTEIDDHVVADEFDSHEQMQTYLARLKNEWYGFLLSIQGMTDATENNPVDLSYLIANATFDDMTGATKADPQGWTCEYESKDGGGRDGVAEFWNASAFNIYQELPYLVNGYWRLSVDAVYRAGNAAAEAKNDDGSYKNDEYLYANTLTTKIIQWSDTERGAIKPDDPENYTPIQQLYTQDDVQFDAPNNQANFLKFIEKGRYHNELVFGYGEGIEDAFTGSITIGLKKTVAVANDWCPFDNFRLEYLGLEKPTAVESLGVKTPASAAINAIYSIDGRQQSQLRRGINIVRTADGKITKVLVK